MRRITLAALVAMTIGWGLPAAYAAETSSRAEATEAQDLPVAAPHANIATSGSPSPSNNAGSLPTSAAPDCDGVASSASSVPALLSRLVRSSTAAHGVQCPMPPIPNQSPVEELHP